MIFDFFLYVISVFLLIKTYVHAQYFKRPPLPPGPRGSVLYGAKHLLPASEPWKIYAQWAENFGGKHPLLVWLSTQNCVAPIISFRVYNRWTIVLNSATAVHDLLEKRASIYSDRPKSWMYHEICNRKKSVFNISSSDDRHKQYRKLLQTGLSARATREYWPLLQSEAVRLLESFSSSPERYEKHIRR